jgi:hypothetical protein
MPSSPPRGKGSGILLKIALAQPADEYQDLGRVKDTLLNTLALQPGQFVRT